MADGIAGRTAIVVVDMQKDNVGRFCSGVIPNIRLLLREARGKGVPVVYACDSRHPDDFIFDRLNLPRHAIRGTEGAEVVDELRPAPGELVLEKRMLSAFFGTELDFNLRHLGIGTLIVTGLATPGCVLKTALDAFELGYQVIVPRDCCASPFPEYTEGALKLLEGFRMLRPSVQEVVQCL